MGLLFVASGRSLAATDVPVSDKLLHVAAYLVLGAFALRATHGGVRELRGGPTVAAFLVTAGYGVVDELHQFYVPGRIASVGDWIADALGAALAILLMGLLGSLRAGRARGLVDGGRR